MSGIETPLRVEDYLARGVVERRAHLLDKTSKYIVLSSLGRVPYGAVLDTHLPDYSDTGTLMWVDFRQHTQVGTTVEGKPSTQNRPIGETAIAVGDRDFTTADDVIAENLETDYLIDWLKKYHSNYSRNSFGLLRHPIVAPIYMLYEHIKRSTK